MIVKHYKATASAKRGGRLSDADAERIGDFLEQKLAGVEEEGVTAEEMVKLAKPKRSPIHSDFEWDDGVAGHQYRLVQARSILRSIEVIHENGKSTQTRAFHHVVVESGQGPRAAYVPATVVWDSPDLAAQVVEEAARELASWARRYKEYGQLAEAHQLVLTALELIT